MLSNFPINMNCIFFAFTWPNLCSQNVSNEVFKVYCPPPLFTHHCKRLRKFWTCAMLFAVRLWSESATTSLAFSSWPSLVNASVNLLHSAEAPSLFWVTMLQQWPLQLHHAWSFCSRNVRSLSSSETLPMLLTLNNLHLNFIKHSDFFDYCAL